MFPSPRTLRSSRSTWWGSGRLEADTRCGRGVSDGTVATVALRMYELVSEYIRNKSTAGSDLFSLVERHYVTREGVPGAGADAGQISGKRAPSRPSLDFWSGIPLRQSREDAFYQGLAATSTTLRLRKNRLDV